MKISSILFSTLLLVIISFSASMTQTKQTLNLMPYPKSVEFTGGEFRLTHSFAIGIKGNPDKRIFAYATRVLRRLSGRTGLFVPQDFITETTTADTFAMDLIIKRPGKVELGEDESYQLVVKNNKVTLTAENEIGAMRGLETVLQLIAADKKGYYLPGVKIDDEPRFKWRGLMMDVCRHFFDVAVVKRNIDGMAAMKMNVFHWHLSEDQGFRVESKLFPLLHEKGSDGLYYTQEQIKEVIQYGADRGIRVYPEFDLPGHSTAWFVGYPEFASAPGPYKIERNWGVFDPTFDPTKEATYEFLDKFIGEMAALFPDEYFHIGGDENNGKQWSANPGIQKFMKENNIPDNHALQTYFNKRLLGILTKYNKKMIGWDEILQPDLPKDIVVQSWRGVKFLVESAKKGYMGILSNGYYLDHIQTAEFHYLNDPVPGDTVFTPEEAKLVIGGEVTSWAELVTYETVESRIWPRTAAIAERFWSPQSVRDVEDMYRRLAVIDIQLEELELTHIKNYEMMLRRLTMGADITPLKIFADVVEPVKKYHRHFQGVKYRQHSPYTRVVDAARPESMTARKFRLLTDRYIAGDKSVKTEMLSMLKSWEQNHSSLLKLMDSSPVLREIDTMSSNLAEISRFAIAALEGKKQLEKVAKKVNLNDRLAAAAKPYGQVELMLTAPVEKLVRYVQGKK
ncbi:MAG: family 20 glycosylhydrolase [Ignavibacteriaceae bacterium]|nr:family 20 glycosylhydrolase [Ignavibacteriaceae bacterium]